MVWRLNYKFKMPAEKIRKLGERKALSPVITTVLLILVSVTAIVIISGVIIPFVRDSLSGSKECFETADQLEIDTASVTCYYEDAGEMIAKITIKRGVKETEIERFKISVFGGGSSDSFDIKTGETGVKMLDDSTEIEIPDPGEEKTYSLTTDLTTIESAEVYPVMKSGRLCDSTNRAYIGACEVLV